MAYMYYFSTSFFTVNLHYLQCSILSATALHLLPHTFEWDMRCFFDRAPDCKRIRWQLRCNKINCLLSLSLTPVVSPSSQCPTTKQWCQICLPDVPPRHRKCFVHTCKHMRKHVHICTHKHLPWNPLKPETRMYL